jgi:hypothetical protein
MMDLQEEIAAFKQRIAQAEAKREVWRAAGNRESF